MRGSPARADDVLFILNVLALTRHANEGSAYDGMRKRADQASRCWIRGRGPSSKRSFPTLTTFNPLLGGPFEFETLFKLMLVPILVKRR